MTYPHHPGCSCPDCKVAADDARAEARREDEAWEHEQRMGRRVWDEVHP